MRILLLCSAFNGLTQRAWIELRAAGHEAVVQLAGDADTVRAAVAAVDPDLVICPFLRERVPAEVWTTRRFCWADPTEHVLRRIRAADGSPGVRTSLCGVSVAVFDAHRGTVHPEQLTARSLAARCLPIGAAVATRVGLADTVLPGDPAEFEHAVTCYAARLAADDDYGPLLAAKRARRAADELRKPLCAYRRAELVEMSADIFDDRHGFATARSSFITKQRSPRRLGAGVR